MKYTIGDKVIVWYDYEQPDRTFKEQIDLGVIIEDKYGECDGEEDCYMVMVEESTEFPMAPAIPC